MSVYCQPHWGKNPFVDPSATPETTGGYEIYITKTGKEGYANEMQMADSTSYHISPCCSVDSTPGKLRLGGPTTSQASAR